MSNNSLNINLLKELNKNPLVFDQIMGDKMSSPSGASWGQIIIMILIALALMALIIIIFEDDISICSLLCLILISLIVYFYFSSGSSSPTITTEITPEQQQLLLQQVENLKNQDSLTTSPENLRQKYTQPQYYPQQQFYPQNNPDVSNKHYSKLKEVNKNIKKIIKKFGI